MPRHKDPENLTAQEELLSVIGWAEQMQFFNIAAALRRVLATLDAKENETLTQNHTFARAVPLHFDPTPQAIIFRLLRGGVTSHAYLKGGSSKWSQWRFLQNALSNERAM